MQFLVPAELEHSFVLFADAFALKAIEIRRIMPKQDEIVFLTF
jgi:hypothetical protein